MYTNVKFAYMYIHTYIKFYIYTIHIRISNTLKVYLYPTLNTGSPAFLLKVLSVPLAKVFKSNPSYIHYMSGPVLGFEDSMIDLTPSQSFLPNGSKLQRGKTAHSWS